MQVKTTVSMNNSYVASNKSRDPRSGKESVISSLERCNISQHDRRFYLEDPKAWDWDRNPHLNVGVKAVLFNANYSTPLWIEPEQLPTFRNLKFKYRAIKRAEDAAEEFRRNIGTACDSDDFSFILCLLEADEEAEKVGNDLRQA